VLIAGCTTAVKEPPVQSLLTDQEVEEILASFPYLSDYTDDTPTPEDILQQLKVNTAALELLEQVEGDCISFKTYQLSPSYILLVDDNACLGYRVSIFKNTDL
jgi:hypothetical protein